VAVSNPSSLALNHTVLLFAAADFRRVVPEAQQLKAFRRVLLPAGSSVEVSFTLRADDFRYWGLEERWVVESGDVSLWCDPLLRPKGPLAALGAVTRRRASEGGGMAAARARLYVEGDCRGAGCGAEGWWERDASGERYEIGKYIAHVPGPSPAGVIATSFLAGWLVGLICAGGVWACARRGQASGRGLGEVGKGGGGSSSSLVNTSWSTTLTQRGGEFGSQACMLGAGFKQSHSIGSSMGSAMDAAFRRTCSSGIALGALAQSGSGASLSSVAEYGRPASISGLRTESNLNNRGDDHEAELHCPPELRIDEDKCV